ncbi:Basigin [Microtus ochrogaster]|uniref:Basigin n=1 Tax=Microtus ochrogaster TaxID=79684 RepID=A0A8J6G392_MICOH|nr:Basigin [Microtus ochrogaster]
MWRGHPGPRTERSQSIPVRERNVRLVCKSESPHPPVTGWNWFKTSDSGDQLITNGSESKYIMISTAERSELTISNLHINSDSDTYVRNETPRQRPGEDDTARTRLCLAALWPFLGIVAEVLVLVTIILIYEKRWKPEQTLDENDPGAAPLKGIT